MASVRIKTGSEGSSYDPYSYTECIFTRTDGVRVVLHAGLGVWCKLYKPGEKRACVCAREDHAHVFFYRTTGMWPSQAERIWLKINYPIYCKWCHSKRLKEVDGFPGETLVICRKCEAVVGSHFDESAIM